jgi:hypothetical protein
MISEILRYKIELDYTGFPSWTVGRDIVVSVNDADYSLLVTIQEGESVITTPVTGPDLYEGTNGQSTLITSGPPFYQYCDGTTLNYIRSIETFPYADFLESANDIACQLAPVCDLAISNEFTVVGVSSEGGSDGEIHVSATSSNGTIHYSLSSNFDVFNTTGDFTGLIEGTHTVYAKDSVGCLDSIDIFVGLTIEYGVLFRGEYDTIKDFTTKIEILERSYEGGVTEVCFGSQPFVLDYDQTDKFSPLAPSHCVVTLLEETEDQFEILFTGDDTLYRVDYYKDFGSGYILIWSGFIQPSMYVRPFVRPENNYITVKASDQLGMLKDNDFLDEAGNIYRGELTQLKLISDILKKTRLFLNLRIQDNIFETTMDTDETPLAQSFVDVRIFYDENSKPLKCDNVLSNLIKCKSGLRLFQSRGYWWLVRSENNVDQFDYFEYDLNGNLIGDDTYSPRQNIVAPSSDTGLMWANQSQVEVYDENFGKFELTHNLAFDDNLIDEGRFEEEDIIELANGNRTFKKWNVNPIQTGIRYGLEFVDNGNSKGAFFMDFTQAGGTQQRNVLYSTEIPLESNTYGSSNLIKIKFQYKGVPLYKVPWITFSWQLKYVSNSVFVGTLYLRYSGLPISFTPWTADVDRSYNDVYVDNFNSFQTFEFTAPMPSVEGGTLVLSFFMHNHAGRDYADVADIAGDPALDLDIGKRILGFHPSSDFTHFYELESGDDATSIPDVIRPSDFTSSFDQGKVFRSKGRLFTSASTTSLVRKFLLDNVQVTYIPFDPTSSIGQARNFEPPSEALYETNANPGNKVKYEDEFLLGDLPDMENAKNLYRGYLRLSDGTPTDLWARFGIAEDNKLLQLGLLDRSRRLSGVQKTIQADVLQCGVYFAFVDSLAYDSRYFLNTKYVLDDLNSVVSLYASQIGSSVNPPVIETFEFTTEFTTEFNA